MSGGDISSRKSEQSEEKHPPVEDLDRIFEYLDEKQGILFNRLKDLVEFRTISSDPAMRSELYMMIEVLIKILGKFGMQSLVLPISSDDDEDLPPILLAETANDPSKRTVCVYVHFDVLPLTLQDCYFNPFELSVNSDESELHGKGASVGKGPLLCVINAIGAYQQLKIPLPVNVKLILDPLGTSEEGDKAGKFLRTINHEFFFNVDYVCLALGHWLTDSKPCVSHGCRGLCYFQVEIEGPNKNLHSGAYGGMINEPMTDMVFVLNQLVDKYGNIKITDIYQDVPPVTKEERKCYKNVYFNVRDYQMEIGAAELLVNEDKASILINLWRRPSLSIHGIQGHTPVSFATNVIPKKVTGKFSITLVPNMTPNKVKKAVFEYLSKLWKTRRSSNRICVQMTVGKLFWFTDPENANCVAAKNAMWRAYQEEPDMIRESHRVKMATILRKITDSPLVGIPLSKRNDVSDHQTEKIDVRNYINGAKVFAAYFDQLDKLSPIVYDDGKAKCTCKVTGEFNECFCYLNEEQSERDEKEEELPKWSGTYSSGQVFEDPAIKYYYYSEQVKERIVKLNELINADEELKLVKLEAIPRVMNGEEEATTSESLEPEESAAAEQKFLPKTSDDITSLSRFVSGQHYLRTGDLRKQSRVHTMASMVSGMILVAPSGSKLLSTMRYSDEPARKSLTRNMKGLRSSLYRTAMPDRPSMASKSLAGMSKLSMVRTNDSSRVNLQKSTAHTDHKSPGIELRPAIKGPKVHPNAYTKAFSTTSVPLKTASSMPSSLKIQQGIRSATISPLEVIGSISALTFQERLSKIPSSSTLTLPGSKLRNLNFDSEPDPQNEEPLDERYRLKSPKPLQVDAVDLTDSSIVGPPITTGASLISPKEIISSTSGLLYKDRLNRKPSISTMSLAGSRETVHGHEKALPGPLSLQIVDGGPQDANADVRSNADFPLPSANPAANIRVLQSEG